MNSANNTDTSSNSLFAKSESRPWRGKCVLDWDSRFRLPAPTSSTPLDKHAELLASLDRINTYNPPVHTCSTGWKFAGLYSGPTSVAYLFLRLSKFYPDLMFKGQSLRDWGEAYLSLGIYAKPQSVDASDCGITNETLSFLAVRAALEQDPSLVKTLCSYESVINTSEAIGLDEWKDGRAGYLYLLRLARTGFENDSKTTNLINETLKKTAQRIISPEQPWIKHNQVDVGAARGTVGIITQVMLSDPSCAPHLEHIVSDVVRGQWVDTSCNWPGPNLPRGGGEYPVIFCQSSPGICISFRSIAPLFPNIKTEINKAKMLAHYSYYSRGARCDSSCLCHGVAGILLAVDCPENFYKLLRYLSTDYLEQMGWLAEAGRSDEFVGLYTGEAGRAWAWAVADLKLEKNCIGYNDI